MVSTTLNLVFNPLNIFSNVTIVRKNNEIYDNDGCGCCGGR